MVKYSPFFRTKIILPKKPLNRHDLEFMGSLSAAVMYSSSKKIHWVLISFTVTIFVFIVWASFAQIDEIARGHGKVVPSGQNQVIQNLEGGIVSEILVKEGQFVEKEQILIRISNEKSSSSAVSNELRSFYLEAQIKRLNAELNRIPFVYEKTNNEDIDDFFINENELYLSNMSQLNSKIEILKEQLKQKENTLKDTKQTIEHLKFSLEMVTKEVAMTEPMVQRGIRSQVDFLKLQREESDAKQRLQSAILSVEKTNSEKTEIQKRINETYENNEVLVREKLNETMSGFKELQTNSIALSDQVSRTIVKAPSNGIVQKLHINTIGGSIKPAQDLIEIVPTDYNLLIEVKVLPSDIAFIYQGQKAIVKFSAYDFSIYGGLNGKVVNISPDTITEKDDKTYYVVRIETDKNFIGNEKKPMKIIPGMVADVDIITGKKSILDYILKPILKTKQYTFTER